MAVSGLPAKYATATNSMPVRYDPGSGTWYAFTLTPTAYNTRGVPGGSYPTSILSGTTGLTGPFVYQSTSPDVDAGSFSDDWITQCANTTWILKEGSTYVAFVSVRSLNVSETSWGTGRFTASSLAGPFVADGQWNILSPLVSNGTHLMRPENPRVWFSAKLNKWVMANNSVDPSANFTDSEDIIYANGSNAWGIGTTTALASDAFNEAAGTPSAPWQTVGSPALTGTALNLGSAAGTTIVFRTDHSFADSQQQADLELASTCSVLFLFRWQDANNYYQAEINNNGTNVTTVLSVMSGGVLTQLGSRATSLAYHSTVYTTCKVSLLGNRFDFWVGGMWLWSMTDGTITAAGGVGLANGGTGTGNRLVQNWSWASLVATDVYRNRALRCTALDSTTQLAIGIFDPKKDELGNVYQDAAGRVPGMYDGDPPNVFNGVANGGFHLGRRFRSVVLEPHATCLLVTNGNNAYLLKNQPATTFTAEMCFAFQSTTGQLSFCYWMSGTTESATVGYVVTIDTGTRKVNLYSKNGATLTSLASANLVSVSPADGNNTTTERIKIAVDSSAHTHKVWVDSDPATPAINVTNSALPVGGQFGFRATGPVTARVYGLSLRTSDTVTINGLPPGAPMRLRSADMAFASGTTVGGTDTIAASHYPMSAFDLMGADVANSTGDIWGGDVFTLLTDNAVVGGPPPWPLVLGYQFCQG